MGTEKPTWMANLTEEDLEFVKTFVLKSGSLKEMAVIYGVSYPTLRAKLDKLIDKIEVSEKTTDDAYVQTVKALAIDGKISVEAARELITIYRETKKEH
jgi:hypothetical protein